MQLIPDLTLNELPKAIAEERLKLLALAAQSSEIDASIAVEMAAIDGAIANDATLKNDAQRKSARVLSMQTNEVITSGRNLAAVNRVIQTELDIAIEFYRNELKVRLVQP